MREYASVPVNACICLGMCVPVCECMYVLNVINSNVLLDAYFSSSNCILVRLSVCLGSIKKKKLSNVFRFLLSAAAVKQE